MTGATDVRGREFQAADRALDAGTEVVLLPELARSLLRCFPDLLTQNGILHSFDAERAARVWHLEK
jgi:hypothetical protein